MIDLCEFDARKTVTSSESEQNRVFSKHKERTKLLCLSAFIADYVMEEQSRGNIEIDSYMIFDAIEAFNGGAR